MPIGICEAMIFLEISRVMPGRELSRASCVSVAQPTVIIRSKSNSARVSKRRGISTTKFSLGSRGFLGLLQPAFADDRVQDRLESPFLAGILVNEFPQQRAIRFPLRSIGGRMDFLQDLFPHGFILVEQFAHAGIGVEEFRLDTLREQISKGRFSGSDSPCYSENGHTKQFAESWAG